MASNLACVGLAAANEADLNALIRAVRPNAVGFGHVAGIELLRWEDPSGARLVLGLQDGRVISLLPSFAAGHETRLAGVRRANDEVAIAAVVDDDGEQLTSLALELEQIRLLGDSSVDEALAAITFLGRRVTVHEDSDAFARSAASLLDPNAGPNEPPPTHYVEHGLKWPPRVGDESFFSFGVFGEPAHAEAGGRFAGRVIHAERRTVQQSGQTFIVATVRSVGIDASVCLSGTEFDTVPVPGQVIAGEVFIVGSVPALEQPNTRSRWWQRRRA
jgi:hypothetical protein